MPVVPTEAHVRIGTRVHGNGLIHVVADVAGADNEYYLITCWRGDLWGRTDGTRTTKKAPTCLWCAAGKER